MVVVLIVVLALVVIGSISSECVENEIINTYDYQQSNDHDLKIKVNDILFTNGALSEDNFNVNLVGTNTLDSALISVSGIVSYDDALTNTGIAASVNVDDDGNINVEISQDEYNTGFRLAENSAITFLACNLALSKPKTCLALTSFSQFYNLNAQSTSDCTITVDITITYPSAVYWHQIDSARSSSKEDVIRIRRVTQSPTLFPSNAPVTPTTKNPTKNPTVSPTFNPTEPGQTRNPTSSPTTSSPTMNPIPTQTPTDTPTRSPLQYCYCVFYFGGAERGEDTYCVEETTDENGFVLRSCRPYTHLQPCSIGFPCEVVNTPTVSPAI